MGVLRLTAANSDRLKWTTLTTALANVSDGAWTAAYLVKRASLPAAFAAGGYLLSSTGAGTAEAGFSFHDDDRGVVDVSAGFIFPTALTSTASPYLIVVSKGAGTVTPRLGWKLGVGGAWTHENGDATLADQIAATMLEIGAWQGGDFFDGWIGLVAFWEGAMSDANKEALDNNWATRDLWNSAHGTPAFLVELNVVGSRAYDLANNASVLTATGTTIDAAETLDGWTFDGVTAVGGTAGNRGGWGSVAWSEAPWSAEILSGETFPQAIAAVAVGVATLAAELIFGVTMAAVAVGVAVLTRLVTFSRTLAATAVGVVSLLKQMYVTLAATAVGVPALLKGLYKTLTTVAVGVASLTTALLSSVAMAAVAVGVVVLSATKLILQALAATAVGVAVLGAVKIVAGAATRALRLLMGVGD